MTVRMRHPGVAAVVSLTVLAMASPGWSQAYPVKKSASGRYLVDQNNAPFLIAGDAPQSITVNLSTTDSATYFADRASHAFNSLWVNLLCTTYTGGGPMGARTTESFRSPGSSPGGATLRTSTRTTFPLPTRPSSPGATR